MKILAIKILAKRILAIKILAIKISTKRILAKRNYGYTIIRQQVFETKKILNKNLK